MIFVLVGFLTLLLLGGVSYFIGGIVLRNNKYAGTGDKVMVGVYGTILLIIFLLVCSIIGQLVLAMLGFIR